MSGHALKHDLELRPYEPADEKPVLDLLSSALGAGPTGARTAAFFRWKHLENPFGKSFMLVAISDDIPVGFRSFMRWEFCCRGRTVRAVRAVDTATHPAHQGKGIFSHLTQDALTRLEPEVELVFNTPNPKSRRGYLKMGWQEVGQVPVAIRIVKPLRFALGLSPVVRRYLSDRLAGMPPIGAETAASVLRDQVKVEELLNARDRQMQRFETRRTYDYLLWRYATAPFLDYRAVCEERGGRLEGIAIFRARSRGALHEATVTEMLVRRTSDRTVRRLLGRIAAISRSDHLTCSDSALGEHWFSSLKWGSFRSPGGIGLVVNPLAGGVRPDPTLLDSWALTLGDLELF
jgi:GNAT superfamily N-acetyltransferase